MIKEFEFNLCSQLKRIKRIILKSFLSKDCILINLELKSFNFLFYVALVESCFKILEFQVLNKVLNEYLLYCEYKKVSFHSKDWLNFSLLKELTFIFFGLRTFLLEVWIHRWINRESHIDLHNHSRLFTSNISSFNSLFKVQINHY